jgi:hypothetical protein
MSEDVPSCYLEDVERKGLRIEPFSFFDNIK